MDDTQVYLYNWLGSKCVNQFDLVDVKHLYFTESTNSYDNFNIHIESGNSYHIIQLILSHTLMFAVLTQLMEEKLAPDVIKPWIPHNSDSRYIIKTVSQNLHGAWETVEEFDLQITPTGLIFYSQPYSLREIHHRIPLGDIASVDYMKRFDEEPGEYKGGIIWLNLHNGEQVTFSELNYARIAETLAMFSENLPQPIQILRKTKSDD